MNLNNVKKIIVLGTGGNCTDIAEMIKNINNTDTTKKYKFVGYLDDKVQDNCEYLGLLQDWTKYKDCYFVNGIGSTRTFLDKEKILSSLNIPLERYETLVHPLASISYSANVGIGCVIFQNVVVTSNACIGNHVMILPNSVVSHDSIIGDYTVIAGCVCVSGNVTVGKSCYLGANSSFRDGIKISNRCLIGCGANVIKDTDPETTWIGNPAKIMEQQNEKNISR